MRPYLKIANELFVYSPDVLDALFIWLEREEKAKVVEIKDGPRERTYYFEGGIEIADKDQFGITCTPITNGVYSFTVTEKF